MLVLVAMQRVRECDDHSPWGTNPGAGNFQLRYGQIYEDRPDCVEVACESCRDPACHPPIV